MPDGTAEFLQGFLNVLDGKPEASSPPPIMMPASVYDTEGQRIITTLDTILDKLKALDEIADAVRWLVDENRRRVFL